MARCQWKPPEKSAGAEAYEGCQHDCYKDHTFCIFHMALEAKRNDPEMVEDFKASFRAFFEGNVLTDEGGDFRGFIFPDNFDLSGYDFRRSNERKKTTNFTRRRYEPVNFNWSIFGNSVSFESTTFGVFASFNSSQFGDYTSFLRATFGYSARFHDALFGTTTLFYNSELADSAQFIGAHFGDNSILSSMVVGNSVRFIGASFGVNAIFNGSVFGDDAAFLFANFGDLASFHGTTFGGGTSFTGANFQGSVDFRFIKKNENTTRIKEQAGLNFVETEFRGFANFQENDLSNVRFQQVDLRNLTFFNSQISKTIFISCKWGVGPESPRYAKWDLPGQLHFKRPRLLLDELVCRDLRIEEQEIKLNRELNNSLDPHIWLWNRIRVARWQNNYDPKIRILRLGREYEEDNSDEIEIQPSDIEVLALQLKQSLEATKDPIAAGDFHFAVMEMKRMQAMEAKRWGRASMLWLYKTVNGYGERYGRTALWLAMLIGIFSFIYFQMNGLDATVDIKNVVDINKHIPDLGFWKQVWFSIAFAFQNVLPFKLYSNYLCAVGENLHWVRGLAMGETLVGTTLFTFFALALRRRFKR